MEVDDIQNPQQATKYSRVNANGSRLDSSKMGIIGGAGGGAGGGGGSNVEEKEEVVRRAGPITTTATVMNGGEVVASNRFGRQWQNSSRIIRVSRASGGKDRHSKVWTAKGLRDRRVRLSVTTAIDFYDLQDRLGYDQPSKAVEWLIKAAADAINELPSLNNANFPPETPRQVSDERRSGNNNNDINVVVVDDSAEVEFDNGNNSQFVDEHGQVRSMSMSMSKSGCSSNNSETSKGSGLSLSRSEIRVKARKRARERTAKEKDKEGEPLSRVSVQHQQQQHQQQHNTNMSTMSQASSFTQLLTGGISNLNENAAASSTPSPHHGSSGGSGRGRNDVTSNHIQWLSSSCTTPMPDLFQTSFMGLSTTRPTQSIQHLPQVMTLSSFGGAAHNDIHQHHQQQQQHFAFLADQHNHMLQVPNNTTTTTTTGVGASGGGGGGGGSDYNLNFSISPSSTTTTGIAGGFNRGTLQSNSSSSPSLLPYFQRYSITDGGVSSVPFFLGGAPISPAVDHHHHHAYDPAGLQLCYGDGGRHQPDQKGKGKN